MPAKVLMTLSLAVLAKLPVAVLAKLPASVLAKLPASILAKLPTSVLATLIILRWNGTSWIRSSQAGDRRPAVIRRPHLMCPRS